MDVTILQAIQISVWCLFTLRETVIISKTTHIKEKGATASGFTPLGLYQTSNGMCINADINGALNILKKSNVVSLTALYARGHVDSPLRIRLT